MIAEQQSEAEHWTFKAITEMSYINWKKITIFGVPTAMKSVLYCARF